MTAYSEDLHVQRLRRGMYKCTEDAGCSEAVNVMAVLQPLWGL